MADITELLILNVLTLDSGDVMCPECKQQSTDRVVVSDTTTHCMCRRCGLYLVSYEMPSRRPCVRHTALPCCDNCGRIVRIEGGMREVEPTGCVWYYCGQCGLDY